MTLWLRVRGIADLALACAGYLALVWLAGERSTQAPSVIGDGRSSFVWSSYAVLLPALVLARSMERRNVLLERRSARPVLALDLALMTLTIAVLELGTWLIAGQSAIGSLLARNAAVITVLTCLVSTFFGSTRAAGVVVGTVVATQSYSPQARGGRFVRLFQQEASLDLWAIFVLVLGVGLVLATVLWHGVRQRG